MISKNSIELIEPHYQKELLKKEYKQKIIKAKKLLVYSRFDLAFKLLYLENLNKKVQFSKNIYKEHIRAFGLGKYTENGNPKKNSIEKFIELFQDTYESIKNNGFDRNKSLIPLSKNGTIANGAHRVASAIFLDKNVECIELDVENLNYDYKFFYNRNISSKVLDIAATKFVEYGDNIYLAFIWPTAVGHDKDIENVIPNIIYRKEITLNPNGAHNLLSQVYYDEKWIGIPENNFRGSKGKLVECFRNFNPVRIIAFQADSLENVLKIKDKVRSIFNVGKNSIHITDSKYEAIRISRVVFNDNSVHLLNYGKLNKYLSKYQKIDNIKKFIRENKINKSDILIDASLTLSCYGLREAKDTDFFCNLNNELKIKFDKINNHDEVLKYYKNTKQELIYNPNNFFYFNELKFISFKQLYKMKINRGEIKDKNDCKMMEAFIVNDKIKMFINKSKQNFYYEIIKARYKLVLLLKFIGLHKIIKKLITS